MTENKTNVDHCLSIRQYIGEKGGELLTTKGNPEVDHKCECNYKRICVFAGLQPTNSIDSITQRI